MTRRSLTHVGGATETWGEPASAAALAHALEVASAADPEGEDAARVHVHGFHTYPARLHPQTARRLVDAFAPERGVVLDPFCGSGTVVVESMLANRRSLGTDLNPLAVLLAKVKTRALYEGEAERVVDVARAIATEADARRKARAGASRRMPPEDVALFDPHVLLELDSLRTGIEKFSRDTKDERGTSPMMASVRDGLLLVLAALLTKVSRKRGDTALGEAPKRIAAGFTAKFFVKKTQDLVARRAALEALLPPKRPHVRVAEDDATELRSVAEGSVDTIVTSPPYAATYDYLEHHALRLRWLGLDPKGLDSREFGARRAYVALDPDAARAKWVDELDRFLRAVADVTKPGASVILVVADSAIRASHESGVRGAYALRADELVAEAIDELPFEPEARASQARPHFHGPTASAFLQRPRHEHALLLRRLRG